MNTYSLWPSPFPANGLLCKTGDEISRRDELTLTRHCEFHIHLSEMPTLETLRKAQSNGMNLQTQECEERKLHEINHLLHSELQFAPKKTVEEWA